MKKLVLGETYSRRDVHGIFSPESKFVPQAGTWGLHGIVSVPDKASDYVFFVTLGQQQGDHVFDEGISDEGVLTWQSQPRQGLEDARIINFINHDETLSNIYLFFRHDKRKDYMFYGRLGYLTHDANREKPVYFQWQLLDWDDLNNKSVVILSDSAEQKPDQSEMLDNPLFELKQSELPPSKPERIGTDTATFRARKVSDYAQRDANNRKLGEMGELLVVAHEKKVLSGKGFPGLSDQVRHIAQQEGDGAGYDVLSFRTDGSKKYIEVKTTRGGAQTDFYMSINEIRFSDYAGADYYLYRLYNFKEESQTADFYINSGPVDESFTAEPINFRVSLER